MTYVPFRNAHFLSAAVSWAEVIGANAIFIGAVEEDSSGYPDCRPEYYRAFRERDSGRDAAGDANRDRDAGDRDAQKRDRAAGRELGAPLERTWSCYQFEDDACGMCDSCRLRLRAFAEAGVADPIAYRDRLAGQARVAR